MRNNSFKKLLETQDAIRRQLEPLSATMKALEEDAGLRLLAEDLSRHQEVLRAAYGPLEELRQAGLLYQASQLGSEFPRLLDMIAETQTRFRLPEIAETAKLLQQFENSSVANVTKRYVEQESEFHRAMEAMRAPWLDVENKLRSIAGFVELQGIGHALRAMPAFDAHLAHAIRIDLGDWRKKIVWPPEIFTDSLARTSFYTAQGLDSALTAFPPRAFEESLGIAGLKSAPPPLVRVYYIEPKVEGEDEEETGFERTNAAHDRLQRFESQMRKFIDERMKAAFGENWVKHQVPDEIRQRWLDKRQKARDHGEPEWPLIAYADFADYVPIITRKDNWEGVFEPIFGRPAFVQESFQRLYPIRICTMHARLITQDDELYLYVETKRLLGAIGVKI